MAGSVGPNLPGIGETDSQVGLAAWANADRITADDGNPASAASITLDTQTVLLVGRDLAIAIPPGNVLVGIEVEIERGSTGDRCRDFVIQMWKDEVLLGDNKADVAVQWPASLAKKTYGGPADNWGLSGEQLTPDWWTDGVGVAIQCGKTVAGIGGASVDYFTIKVYYDVPLEGGSRCTLTGIGG